MHVSAVDSDTAPPSRNAVQPEKVEDVSAKLPSEPTVVDALLGSTPL